MQAHEVLDVDASEAVDGERWGLTDEESVVEGGAEGLLAEDTEANLANLLGVAFATLVHEAGPGADEALLGEGVYAAGVIPQEGVEVDGAETLGLERSHDGTVLVIGRVLYLAEFGYVCGILSEVIGCQNCE